MKITSITASLSRKLPHPAADFASMSGFASVSADVSPEDDLAACFADLQLRVDDAVERQIEGFMQSFRPQPRKALASPADATANTADGLAAKHSK